MRRPQSYGTVGPHDQAYPEVRIYARYVLMDSVFTMPANACALKKHLDVIGMVKKTPKVCYEHEGRKRNLVEIYQNITKRRGRAKVLSSTTIALKTGSPAKIVFARNRRKKDWLALLFTDINLPIPKLFASVAKNGILRSFFKW